MAKHANPAERPLTRMERLFVQNWKGNQTDAARSAGYKNPEYSGWKVYNRPIVKKAIQEKESAMVRESAKLLVREIRKADITGRLIKLADTSIDETGGSIAGQVNALKVLAEMEGWIIRKTEDVTKLARGRSTAELEHFAVNGYWPEDNNVQSDQSSAAEPSRRGAEDDRPN